MLIALFQPPSLAGNRLAPDVRTLFLAGNVVAFSLFVFFTMYYFVAQNIAARRLIRAERAKSENLLLNVLPAEVAAVLKDAPGHVADHYDDVSILFADLVGFTPLSASMSPVELVELLDAVFSDLDALVERHGLEKIKTIGDCYMVAAGVPRPRADHAEALVRMALEARDHLRDHDYLGRRLSFRIGINSGPVVAGVIGRKKFIYDLWGDAVNTASRMESHGVGGTIQITRSTWELVRHAFACEPCGTIEIKGKGPMEVWHVTGPVAEPA